ncbi:MAG: hypothetical protein NW226_17055 [Microscillaceae bacterium]|nr:hypothetical protein [Microscillaceae bacterium]
MKNIITIFFTIILLLIGIFSILQSEQYKSEYRKKDKELILYRENASSSLSYISYLDSLKLVSEGFFLDKNTKVKSINGNTLELSKILEEKKMILYYSSLHFCDCFQSDFLLLKNFLDSTNCNKILVLTEFNHERELKLFRKENASFCEIYQIEQIKIPMIKTQIPFLFLMDKSLRVSYVFSLSRGNSPNLLTYLKSIQQLLNVKPS